MLKRIAIAVRFADEERRRWAYLSENGVETCSAVLPPSGYTWRESERERAERALARIGVPWSLPLAEPPHLVELDAAAVVQPRIERLERELAELRAELAR